MFEMHREPSPGRLMRHRAWQIHQTTLSQCHALDRDLTFDLTTALGLLGRPAPYTCDLPGGDPHVAFADASSMRHVDGAQCRRWAPLGALGAVIDVGGVRCLSPAATFARMAGHCSLDDLVAIGDSLTCRDRSLRRVTANGLVRFLDGCGRFVGRPQAMHALRLVRENTDSPAETRLRLLAMRCGLPCPEPDVIIAKDPREIRIDMGWPLYRVGLDYHGAHHREQYEADLDRANAILAERWIVFQITAGMIADDDAVWALFSDVAAALRRAGASGVASHAPVPTSELGRRPSGRPRIRG